jgi:hypothetical protein
MAMSAQPAIDEARLNAFVGRMLGDLGAVTNAVLVHIGDQLGFYKAMTKSGPIDSAALAKQTGTSERLVREWLSAQAAHGYLTYDKTAQKFSLSPEQAMVFADEESPFFMAGFFDIAACSMMCRRSSTHSNRMGRWPGTNIMVACSAAPSAYSAPPTIIILSTNGCQRWKVSWRSCNRDAVLRMLGAGTALRPY